MKKIEDIEKLSAEDLRRIGADESIPLPEDLQVRLPRPAARYWSIAAAAAVMVGIAGWSLSRPAEPRDTFDDPYLAYAAVEKAMNRIAGTVQYGAEKIAETESAIDKINYWK